MFKAPDYSSDPIISAMVRRLLHLSLFYTGKQLFLTDFRSAELGLDQEKNLQNFVGKTNICFMLFPIERYRYQYFQGDEIFQG